MKEKEIKRLTDMVADFVGLPWYLQAFRLVLHKRRMLQLPLQ